MRSLVVVLGDQLDAASSAFDGFDASRDAVWMAEVAEESTHVWSSKPRIAVFLAAMRHFRAARESAGIRVFYSTLDDAANTGTLAGELARAVRRLKPQALVMTEAGDHRVAVALESAAEELGVPLDVRTDRHFFATRDDFRQHALGRKQLRQEFYYRELRRRHRVLVDDDGEPAGGQWNFDHDNRGAFGKAGPGRVPPPVRFAPDAITSEVLALVEKRFAGHPGNLADFDWPVTPEDARRALDDFIEHRLADFGRYQDAMWTNEPWLYHSRLSAALNLKLLDPRPVVAAAEKAWRDGRVPLTGLTEMACLRDSLGQTLRLGYAHHIQRLMVTGLYALMLGVDPRQVHAWYLAVYVDAVEWVELPNTLGMSQYADGGVMASKPYVATGKYIQRMSNACAGCRFDPAKATGDSACPFTTLYWDFLLRHEKILAANQRMALQVKNLARLGSAERAEICRRAEAIRAQGGQPPPTARRDDELAFGDDDGGNLA